MGDDNKAGAVPFKGPVTTDPKVSQPPAPQAQPAAEPAKEPTPSEFITRKDFEEALEAKDKNLEKFAQSLLDRQATGFQKNWEKNVQELKGSIAALKTQGVDIPDNLNIEGLALQRTLNEPAGTSSGELKGLEPAPGDALNPETAWALDLEKTMGVKLEANDVELATVKTDGTPEEYKSSYLAALSTKSARVQSPNADSRPNPARSPGTMPLGGGNNNPIQDITDPTELMRIHREQREAG